MDSYINIFFDILYNNGFFYQKKFKTNYTFKKIFPNTDIPKITLINNKPVIRSDIYCTLFNLLVKRAYKLISVSSPVFFSTRLIPSIILSRISQSLNAILMQQYKSSKGLIKEQQIKAQIKLEKKLKYEQRQIKFTEPIREIEPVPFVNLTYEPTLPTTSDNLPFNKNTLSKKLKTKSIFDNQTKQLMTEFFKLNKDQSLNKFEHLTITKREVQFNSRTDSFYEGNSSQSYILPHPDLRALQWYFNRLPFLKIFLIRPCETDPQSLNFDSLSDFFSFISLSYKLKFEDIHPDTQHPSSTPRIRIQDVSQNFKFYFKFEEYMIDQIISLVRH